MLDELRSFARISSHTVGRSIFASHYANHSAGSLPKAPAGAYVSTRPTRHTRVHQLPPWITPAINSRQCAYQFHVSKKRRKKDLKTKKKKTQKTAHIRTYVHTITYRSINDEGCDRFKLRVRNRLVKLFSYWQKQERAGARGGGKKKGKRNWHCQRRFLFSSVIFFLFPSFFLFFFPFFFFFC